MRIIAQVSFYTTRRRRHYYHCISFFNHLKIMIVLYVCYMIIPPPWTKILMIIFNSNRFIAQLALQKFSLIFDIHMFCDYLFHSFSQLRSQFSIFKVVGRNSTERLAICLDSFNVAIIHMGSITIICIQNIYKYNSLDLHNLHFPVHTMLV